jgi:N-acetylglucosamine-6-phosphate deacetylase
MDMGVKNLVKHCDITLEEAIRMATLYPAKAVKIDDRYGKLQPDYFAEHCIEGYINEDGSFSVNGLAG